MAVFAGIDLKLWREAQGISAADLAERISCDTTTIYRYESGKVKPNPDVIYQICAELGDISKWQDWMRTEYPMSYGRVHPETSKLDLKGAIMELYAEIGDTLDIQRDVLKDGSDGTIDDTELLDKVINEVTELLQSAQRVRNIANQQKGAN